jgi:hypothetical protein
MAMHHRHHVDMEDLWCKAQSYIVWAERAELRRASQLIELPLQPAWWVTQTLEAKTCGYPTIDPATIKCRLAIILLQV